MLDTGATAWMLTSASLVFLMSPALALFYGGGGALLLTQFLVAVAALAFSAAITFPIGYLLKKTLGWRIADPDERRGIDQAVHAEVAYEGRFPVG